jgi:flagellar motor switch protein FliG
LNHALPSPTALTPLQKAAVLINSLDMRAADALLDQMPPAQAERIREALLQLHDVSAEAQEAVIAEFLQSGGKLPASLADEDNGVELELTADVPVEQTATAGLSPFYFLQDASPSLLAEFLRAEHPQTVAVILANLDPDQAARVLERLPAELSMESLARMARLHELTPEVIGDLADEIRSQLMPKIEAERRPHGLAGASAVLSALNDPLRKRMLGQLAHRDQSLVRQLGYLDGNKPASSLASARRDRALSTSQAAQLTKQSPEPAASTPPRKHNLSFADVAELSDAALKCIFAHAEPQVVILALTGAESRLVQRILRQLPARDAASLRQRLNHPGPLRLRDVDSAQKELAAIAVDLHEQHVIEIPQLRTDHLSLQS